jgi:hypothetical protein
MTRSCPNYRGGRLSWPLRQDFASMVAIHDVLMNSSARSPAAPGSKGLTVPDLVLNFGTG